MKIAVIIFSITVNLFISSSDRSKLGRTNSSFFIALHHKTASPRTSDIYVKKAIKLYNPNQTETDTHQTTIISENWFNGSANKSVEHTLNNFPEDAGGFVLKSSFDDTKHELCNGYKVQPYYRNFMDGPNKDSFSAYGINVKENNTYAIKIYVKKLGSKLHCFKLQSDSPNQAQCLCALALSAHNLLAVSVRGIHPHYNPLTIFKINHQGESLSLTNVMHRNSHDGSFFKKLSFLNEHELIGWHNIGDLMLITCKETLNYKRMTLPKSIVPPKDYCIDSETGELSILTNDDILYSWQTISNSKTIAAHLRTICDEIFKDSYKIIGIKYHNRMCTIIAETKKNDKTTTHFITADRKTLVRE